MKQSNAVSHSLTQTVVMDFKAPLAVAVPTLASSSGGSNPLMDFKSPPSVDYVSEPRWS